MSLFAFSGSPFCLKENGNLAAGSAHHGFPPDCVHGDWHVQYCYDTGAIEDIILFSGDSGIVDDLIEGPYTFETKDEYVIGAYLAEADDMISYIGTRQNGTIPEFQVGEPHLPEDERAHHYWQFVRNAVLGNTGALYTAVDHLINLGDIEYKPPGATRSALSVALQNGCFALVTACLELGANLMTTDKLTIPNLLTAHLHYDKDLDLEKILILVKLLGCYNLPCELLDHTSLYFSFIKLVVDDKLIHSSCLTYTYMLQLLQNNEMAQNLHSILIKYIETNDENVIQGCMSTDAQIRVFRRMVAEIRRFGVVHDGVVEKGNALIGIVPRPMPLVSLAANTIRENLQKPICRSISQLPIPTSLQSLVGNVKILKKFHL